MALNGAYVSILQGKANIKAMIRLIIQLMILLLSNAVFAAESDVITTSPGEFALLSGYGITHRGYGETRTQVQTFDLIIRYGHFLSNQVGKGHWYQGRHEILLELPWHLAVDHDGRSMVGGTILGSWKFTGAEQFTPYLFAGGGVVYVDLGLPTMGQQTQWYLSGRGRNPAFLQKGYGIHR